MPKCFCPPDLRHAERGVEQRGGGGVEHREVARVEDDAGRVAIAPFDGHRAAVDAASAPARQASVFSSSSAMPCPPPMQAEAMP